MTGCLMLSHHCVLPTMMYPQTMSQNPLSSLRLLLLQYLVAARSQVTDTAALSAGCEDESQLSCMGHRAPHCHLPSPLCHQELVFLTGTVCQCPWFLDQPHPTKDLYPALSLSWHLGLLCKAAPQFGDSTSSYRHVWASV